MKRTAARRDNNEHPLVSLARQLGWWMIPTDEPTDWIAWFRGSWELVEIKNPDCEGHADEFTPKQQKFRKEAAYRGAKLLVWRRDDDVIAETRSRSVKGNNLSKSVVSQNA